MCRCHGSRQSNLGPFPGGTNQVEEGDGGMGATTGSSYRGVKSTCRLFQQSYAHVAIHDNTSEMDHTLMERQEKILPLEAKEKKGRRKRKGEKEGP